MFPVIADRRIRLALVGCGRIEQHADRVELIAAGFVEVVTHGTDSEIDAHCRAISSFTPPRSQGANFISSCSECLSQIIRRMLASCSAPRFLASH